MWRLKEFLKNVDSLQLKVLVQKDLVLFGLTVSIAVDDVLDVKVVNQLIILVKPFRHKTFKLKFAKGRRKCYYCSRAQSFKIICKRQTTLITVMHLYKKKAQELFEVFLQKQNIVKIGMNLFVMRYTILLISAVI